MWYIHNNITQIKSMVKFLGNVTRVRPRVLYEETWCIPIENGNTPSNLHCFMQSKAICANTPSNPHCFMQSKAICANTPSNLHCFK